MATLGLEENNTPVKARGATKGRKLFVVYNHLHSIKRFLSKINEENFSGWLYFSTSTAHLRQLEVMCGGRIPRLETAELLQKYAQKNRESYIDYVGSLSNEHAENTWWCTSFSEKNLFVSDVYLNICRINVLRDIISKTKGDIFVICDSVALIHAIQENIAVFDGIDIMEIGLRQTEIRRRGANFYSFIVQKSWFILWYLYRICIVRYYLAFRGEPSPGKTDTRPVVLHSWTDMRSLEKNEEYTEVYLGDLPGILRRDGEEAISVLSILPKTRYRSAVKKIRQYHQNLRIFEEFLTFRDVLHSFMTILCKFPVVKRAPEFESIIITPLIQEELSRDRYFRIRSEMSYLQYFASQRIAKKINPKTVVYPFENHMWEKMLLRGFEESGTGTKCVGYAHTIVSPMYLSYSCSEYESDRIPLPDTILVNGPFSRDTLINSGFHRQKILVSGSLRNTAIGDATKGERSLRSHRILIAPSAGVGGTKEIIIKMIEALRDSPDIQVLIKPHPTTPRDRLQSIIRLLPAHFSIIDDPIYTILHLSEIVVYNESMVSVEALWSDIPVLHVESDIRIDMDLFSYHRLVPSMSSPEAIRNTIRKILASPPERNEQLKQFIRDLIVPLDEMVVLDAVT